MSADIPGRSSRLDTFQQCLLYCSCLDWHLLDVECFGGDGEVDSFLFFFFPFLVLKSSHQNGSNKIKQEERNKEEITKSIAPCPSSNLCHFSPLIRSANITLVAGKLSGTGELCQ